MLVVYLPLSSVGFCCYWEGSKCYGSDLVEKLGLIFPKCRSKRKYGCVGFDYGNLAEEDDAEDDDEDELEELQLKTAQGHEILSERDKASVDQLNKQRVS